MKFSKYNIEGERDGKKIYINLKSSKWVKITTQEVLDRINYLKTTADFSLENSIDKALYERGFIVDDDFNEYEHLKAWWENEIKESSKTLHVMIYTTDQCNFRCIYCPEKHVSKKLSDKYWTGLYNLIKKGLENSEYEQITMCFFGGEPLLETKKILEFLYKIEPLRKTYKNVDFCHTITTNGYLLTKELYKELNNLGMKRYQITVDGFKETHDIARPLVDGKGTWDVIINNLKAISNLNDKRAEIHIRTNSNDTVDPTLESFYKWANNTFPNENFFFDLQGVTNFSGDLNEDLLAKDDSNHLKKNNEIRKMISERTYSDALNILIKGCMMCRTSNKNAFALFTNGKISKCEAIHMGEGTIVGELQENGTILYDYNIEDWHTDMEYEECENCIQYPLCGGRACPFRKTLSTGNNRLDCAKHDEEKFLQRVQIFIESSGLFD